MWIFFPALAQAADRHVELVDDGPMQMRDKRDYDTLVVIGPRLFPPGIGGRVLRSLSDEVTLMVGAGYGGFDLRLFGLRAAAQRIDARAGLDLQPLGNGMHGFYVGPRVVYKMFVGEAAAGDSSAAIHTQTLGVGGALGWRWVWDPGLSVGIGVGAAWNQFLVDAGEYDDDPEIALIGLAPLGEFTIGWAF